MARRVEVVFKAVDEGVLPFVDKIESASQRAGSAIDRAFASGFEFAAQKARQGAQEVTASLTDVERAWREVEAASRFTGDREAVTARQTKNVLRELSSATIDLKEKELTRAETREREASLIVRGYQDELSVIKQINQEMDRTRPGITSIQDELAALQKQTSRGGPTPPGVAGLTDPFNVRPNRTSSGTLSDEAVLARFNTAARQVNQESAGAARNIDQLARRTDTTARTLDLLGKGLASISGVPKSEAISQIAGSVDQFNSMSVSSAAIGGNLAKFGPAAALGAVGLTLIGKVFVDIRRDSELLLANARKLAEVSRTGIQGGASQTSTELQQLRIAREEVRQLIAIGEQASAQRLIESVLGRGGNAQILDSRFSQALERAQRLGLDTRDPRQLEAERERERIRKQEIQEANEINRIQLETGNREFEERQRKRELDREAVRAIQDLRGEIQDNPFEKLYREANRAQDDFLSRFKGVSQELTGEFARLRQEKLGFDIFKEDLAGAGRLNQLIADRARVEGGLGGADIRAREQQIERERAEIIREIESRRREGTLDRQSHFELLDRLNRTGASAADRIDAEFRQRQIETAQAALERAATDAQRQFANQQLLSATSQIGALTPDQQQVRIDAIDRQIQFEQAQAQKQTALVGRVEQAVRLFAQSIGVQKEVFEKGIPVDFNIRDKSPSLDAELGVAPGVEAVQGGLSNNF